MPFTAPEIEAAAKVTRQMAAGPMAVLLHYFYSAEPHPTYGTQFFDNAVNLLVSRDLLDRSHKLTDRGSVYVEMLLSTPLPEMRWVDPRE